MEKLYSMKTRFILILLIGIASLGGIYLLSFQRERSNETPPKLRALSLPYKMNISSPAFKDNERIPSQYTCDGENVNPPLEISDVPSEAKSLVLIVDDPDAPGKTWVHWVVWNIDPTTTEILENSVPIRAVEGMTDFGKPGYGGPCPPSGTHRYFFKLYALDTLLDISSQATKADVEKAMEGHMLTQATLIGLYSRGR